MKLNQKGAIAQIIILLLLAAGIAAGIFLIKNPQIFKSKAGGGPIFFRQVNGDALPRTDQGVTQITTPTFQVELNSTLGSPVFATPTTSPTSTDFGKALRITTSSTGFITVPTKLPSTATLKLELWIKPYSESLVGSNPYTILTKEIQSGEISGYDLSIVNKKFQVTIAQKTANSSTPSYVVITGRTNLEAGKWYWVSIQAGVDGLAYLIINENKDGTTNSGNTASFASPSALTTPRDFFAVAR